MINIHDLLIFIGGIVFALYIIPICDNILKILETYIEVVASSLNIDITKNNIEMQNLVDEARGKTDSQSAPIGFSYEEEEEGGS